MKAKARAEFEAAKEEQDPLIIARMLVTGRVCSREVQRKFNEADRKCRERIQTDVYRSAGGDGTNDVELVILDDLQNNLCLNFVHVICSYEIILGN